MCYFNQNQVCFCCYWIWTIILSICLLNSCSDWKSKRPFYSVLLKDYETIFLQLSQNLTTDSLLIYALCTSSEPKIVSSASSANQKQIRSSYKTHKLTKNQSSQIIHISNDFLLQENFQFQFTNQNLGFMFEREQIGTWHCHENSPIFKNLKLSFAKNVKKILAKYFLLYRQINYLRLIHKNSFIFPLSWPPPLLAKLK